MRRTIVLVALLCIGCSGPEDPSEDGRRIDLPVLTALGDIPEGERVVTIDVTVAGRIFVDGGEEAVGLLELRDHLQERREALRRAGKEWVMGSRLQAVLRLDRRLPWCAASWVMLVCTEPSLDIFRLYFVARLEDSGDEGSVAYFLPGDRGPNPTPAQLPDVCEARLRVRPCEPATSPAALYTVMSGVAADIRRKTHVDLVMPQPAGSSVPVGTVLAYFDAMLRAEVASVSIGGWAPIPTDRSSSGIVEGVAQANRESMTFCVVWADHHIGENSDGSSRLPPARRVSGDYGQADDEAADDVGWWYLDGWFPPALRPDGTIQPARKQ